MLHDLKEKGFASIVEVIVTSVIVVIAVAGISTTVSMLKPHGSNSSRKIEAAYIGRGIIDNLRQQISATGWNDPDSNLALGTYNFVVDSYSVNYMISSPMADIRQLTMNITWPD